jgi:hypothetical protein
VPGTDAVTVNFSARDSFGLKSEDGVIEVPEVVDDSERPSVTLAAPATGGPFRVFEPVIEATDNVGLAKIVANVYNAAGVLVTSTQSAADGAASASHTASIALPDGAYTLRYNAHDVAGNVSQTHTFAFTLDTTKPTATIKQGAPYTVATGDTYDVISFKLFDAQKIDRVVLNGKVKDLTDNQWSDVNFIAPPTFGAVQGENTLVVFDVAGNEQIYTFTLN